MCKERLYRVQGKNTFPGFINSENWSIMVVERNFAGDPHALHGHWGPPSSVAKWVFLLSSYWNVLANSLSILASAKRTTPSHII